MSENNLELFDIIYIEKLKTAHIDGYSGRWIIDRKGNNLEHYQPYILKSKYDTEIAELKKEIERLKSK